jgi:hypothetical protein
MIKVNIEGFCFSINDEKKEELNNLNVDKIFEEFSNEDENIMNN